MTKAISTLVGVHEEATKAFSTLVGVQEEATKAFSTLVGVQEEATRASTWVRRPLFSAYFPSSSLAEGLVGSLCTPTSVEIALVVSPIVSARLGRRVGRFPLHTNKCGNRLGRFPFCLYIAGRRVGRFNDPSGYWISPL